MKIKYGEKPIARGAETLIYEALAIDETGEHKIAVKRLKTNSPNPGLRHLRNEYEVNQALQRQPGFSDSHIITIYGLNRVRGNYELWMEFVQGRTLNKIAETRAGSNPEYIRNTLLYMRLVCEALQFMHKAGYIHGDIRPDHILAGEQGLKLIDFGFSTKIGEPVELKGTPEYLAPEEIYAPLRRKHLGTSPYDTTQPRVDIYNLGRTFYKVFGGKVLPVINANGREDVINNIEDVNFLKQLRGFPDNLEDSAQIQLNSLDRAVAKGLEETLLRGCLVPHPAKRFQTIEEVTRAIEETEKLLKLA